MGRNGVFMLGVPVDDITLDEAVDRVFGLVRDAHRTGRTHQIATVNVDFIVNARFDSTLRSILRRTSLSIPDGMPIVWGSRLLGTSVRERVAGADLVPALGARAALTGTRLALLGAGPGVAQRAANLLRSAFPGLHVVADPGPSFTSINDLSLNDLTWLAREAPDICCVAFGNPKQEFFIDRFGSALGIPVMIGVGGTLDFLVGAKRRAPDWMRSSGLEWAHRLGSEPQRLGRRYIRDARLFIPSLLRQAWTGRARVARGALQTHSNDTEIIIDLSEVLGFDNQGAAALAGLIRGARQAGRSLSVIGNHPGMVWSVPGLSEWIEEIRLHEGHV